MIEVETEICDRIWRTGELPTPLTQSLNITLPKKSCNRPFSHSRLARRDNKHLGTCFTYLFLVEPQKFN